MISSAIVSIVTGWNTSRQPRHQSNDYRQVFEHRRLRSAKVTRRNELPTAFADVLDCAWEAGVAALPIVTVVNVLVGGILAFVGAVQLRRFGAGIYVADLVGVAEAREMAR